MQIETFRIFCDLAEVKSFTKTAKLHAVTQSAISQAVGALERQFQSQLIDRKGKQFHLSHEGQALYDHAKRILRDFELLQKKLAEVRDAVAGKIRVTCVYSIGLHDLPPYVKRFLKECPDVNVHLEYRRINEVHDAILSNAADLGVVAFPKSDTRFRIVTFRKDPLVLACHPQHVLAKLSMIKITRLNGLKMVGFALDTPTGKAVDKILKAHSVYLGYAMEFDNIETAKRAVEIDSGVAILPETTIRAEVASKSLAAVPLAGSYFRPLAVIHRKGKTLTPAMKRFIELLSEPLSTERLE